MNEAGRRSAALLALLGLLGLFACRDVPTGPPASLRPAGPESQMRVMEVSISGIGTDVMRSAVRFPGAGVHGPSLALTPVRRAGGAGDGSVALQLVSTGSFVQGVRGAGGVRYLHASFRVRNAETGGSPYDTPRENLTFVAVSTATNLGGTAITRMRRFDGTLVVNAALARGVLPTGAVAQNPITGTVASGGPDVLQVFTEAEAASVTAPAAVTTVFPYGFVVRHATSTSSRTLAASPAPDQFDGVVTFAFRVPLQPVAADDPHSITFTLLAVDDGETRLTQGLEEQSPAGEAALQARATSLGATTITILPGGGAFPGSRLVCAVRTAGTAAAPAAYLVNACP